MNHLFKYPRTPHIEGSRYQPGDEDLDCILFSNLINKHLVVEEKVDGSNSAISFDEDGRILLQSRGHYLTGGPRERHFGLMKSWANTHLLNLFELLGSRYIMYGEWLFAKHTVLYTDLPNYFLEFDLYDKQTGVYLSTTLRREKLAGYPFISSVPVLFEGSSLSYPMLKSFIGPSNYILHDQQVFLRQYCAANNLAFDQIVQETDTSGIMEGLYVKVEHDGEVRERYKFIRASFYTTVLNSNTHWLERTIIPNQLKPGTDIFQ